MRWYLLVAIETLVIICSLFGQDAPVEAVTGGAATLTPPDPFVIMDEEQKAEAPFQAYSKSMREAVHQHWDRLMQQAILLPPLRTDVILQFAILRDGSVRDIALASPSGNLAMDMAAWQALADSSPLPVLPANLFRGKPVRVRFVFSYRPGPRFYPTKGPVAYLPATAPWRGPHRPVTTTIIPLGGAYPKTIDAPLPPASPRDGFTPQSGTLLASLVISKNGVAKHVKILKGLNPEQDAATVKTLKTWKFEPITRYDKPIEMPINVEVTFNLER